MSEQATEAEASGVEMAKINWRGVSFEIPRFRADWPFDAVVAAEQEKFPSMIAALLPPSALAAFRALRPTERDAYDLVGEISKGLGFNDAGESPASTS